jgi:hypothetical protein
MRMGNEPGFACKRDSGQRAYTAVLPVPFDLRSDEPLGSLSRIQTAAETIWRPRQSILADGVLSTHYGVGTGRRRESIVVLR